jgi:hypothetical protein
MALRPTTGLRSVPPPSAAEVSPPVAGGRRLWAAAAVLLLVIASAFGYRSLGPAQSASRPLSALGAALCGLPEQAEPTAMLTVGDERIEVGAALREELEARRLALLDGCDVEVEAGDLPEPFGDGAATSVLRLTDGDDSSVMIRVRAQPDRPTRLLGFCALPACTARAD